MIPRFYLIVGGLALTLGGIWWWGHTRYKAGETAAEARWAAATAEAGRKFGEALAAQQAVLVAAEGQLADLRGQRQSVRTVIREVYRNDPVAADWARQPVPPGVRDAAGRALGLPTHSGEPVARLF